MTPPLPPTIQAIKDRHETHVQHQSLQVKKDVYTLLAEYERLRAALISARYVAEIFNTTYGEAQGKKIYNILNEALNPTGGEELGEGGGS